MHLVGTSVLEYIRKVVDFPDGCTHFSKPHSPILFSWIFGPGVIESYWPTRNVVVAFLFSLYRIIGFRFSLVFLEHWNISTRAHRVTAKKILNFNSMHRFFWLWQKQGMLQGTSKSGVLCWMCAQIWPTI